MAFPPPLPSSLALLSFRLPKTRLVYSFWILSACSSFSIHFLLCTSSFSFPFLFLTLDRSSSVSLSFACFILSHCAYRGMMYQLRARRTRAPNPFPLFILGRKFSIATFRSTPIPHVLLLNLKRADLILLLEPPSQAYPDVSVQLVEGSRRIDRSVVAGPTSYQRVDRL